MQSNLKFFSDITSNFKFQRTLRDIALDRTVILLHTFAATPLKYQIISFIALLRGKLMIRSTAATLELKPCVMVQLCHINIFQDSLLESK